MAATYPGGLLAAKWIITGTSPLNYSSNCNGSWSDFITWTILKIYDWLINWLFVCIQPLCFPLCVQKPSIHDPTRRWNMVRTWRRCGLMSNYYLKRFWKIVIMFCTHIYQKTSIYTIIFGIAHMTKPSYLKQLTYVSEKCTNEEICEGTMNSTSSSITGIMRMLYKYCYWTPLFAKTKAVRTHSAG